MGIWVLILYICFLRAGFRRGAIIGSNKAVNGLNIFSYTGIPVANDCRARKRVAHVEDNIPQRPG
jgi:hypothetical protein